MNEPRVLLNKGKARTEEFNKVKVEALKDCQCVGERDCLPCRARTVVNLIIELGKRL